MQNFDADPASEDKTDDKGRQADDVLKPCLSMPAHVADHEISVIDGKCQESLNHKDGCHSCDDGGSKNENDVLLSEGELRNDTHPGFIRCFHVYGLIF